MLGNQFSKRIGLNVKLKTSANFPFKVVYIGLNLFKINWQYFKNGVGSII